MRRCSVSRRGYDRPMRHRDRRCWLIGGADERGHRVAFARRVATGRTGQTGSDATGIANQCASRSSRSRAPSRSLSTSCSTRSCGSWRRRSVLHGEERSLGLPGDEFVAEPQWTYTMRSRSTPRAQQSGLGLLQLGQGRGGFYSYETLKNLVGCQINNVMEIRPELQRLRVGDTIVTARTLGFGPPVTRIEPGRSLVLGGPPNNKGSQATWAFHLLDGPRRPRACSSGAVASPAGLGGEARVGPYLMDPIGFVMSKRCSGRSRSSPRQTRAEASVGRHATSARLSSSARRSGLGRCCSSRAALADTRTG